MKTISMLDEKDVRSEVNDTISCAYEGKDWCEDGSIRQDIKDLKSNVVDLDNNMDQSHSDIHILQVKVKKLNEKLDNTINRIAVIEGTLGRLV